jgi:hypothetical protein
MRGIVWRVFFCVLFVGIVLGATHEHRWGTAAWNLGV